MNKIFKQNNIGLTLVEVLLATFILTIGIASILLLFVRAMSSTQFAWDMTVATSHAEHVLEEMQSRRTLGEVVSMNWEVWVDQEELEVLPQENIAVEFGNKSSDPLDVMVRVNWQNQRNEGIMLKTKLTK